MKILAFSDFAPDEGDGGVERALSEVYSRLAGAHEIRLVTLSSSAPVAHEPDTSRFTIVRCKRIPLERITGVQASLSVSLWKAALREADQFRPDVIHAHTVFFHSSLAALAASVRHHMPLVTTVHVGSVSGLPQPQKFLVSAYEQTLGRAILRKSSTVIAVSNDVSTHLGRLGVPARKRVVVPNGVDLLKFHPDETRRPVEPVVTFVGRLIFNKGPHILLDALGLLRRDGVPFRSVIVGDGPMRSRLERRARELEIASQVEFLGSRQDVADILRRSSVFVRPSYTEGMSLAVLEAMAAELPCVVSAVSGNAELIRNGESGWVVPPGNAAALADRLGSLLKSAEMRRRFGQVARLDASGYSWDSCATRTGEQLAAVAAKRRAR